MQDPGTFILQQRGSVAGLEAEWESARASLEGLLPSGVEIHHVGATSVPGCLTKGDLDVCVRTPPSLFSVCDDALASRYPRNEGSDRTPVFSSFAQGNLGIQLVVRGSELDTFLAFRDLLRADPALLEVYNALKLVWDGRPMDAYRDAKGEFILAALLRRG